jgi:hypothetical protein
LVSEISSKRNQGVIWIATIDELAAYCEARREIDLEVRREKGELIVLLKSNINQAKYGRPKVTLIVKCLGRPRVVLIEEAGKLKEEKDIIFRTNNGERELIVDVPVSAKSIHILL